MSAADLRNAFAKSKSEGRAALVTYVMTGDPTLEATLRLVPRLIEAGADVIELGLPFSDPMADGPVLQASALRSLAAGTTVRGVLDVAAKLSGLGAPIVLMGYINPVLSFGEARFAEEAGKAGVSGVILPDLPADEAAGFAALLKAHGVALVPLVAPTTSITRIHEIASRADGFVYYVSVTGVTGARAAMPTDLAEKVAAARSAAEPAPIAVGFGIGTPDQARAVAPLADGIIVGSAIVRTLQEQGEDAAVALVASIRQALGTTAV